MYIAAIRGNNIIMEVKYVDMKKLFPDEKGAKKGVKEFLEKNGFYVVLLLCIAVVAGTAIFVTTRNATPNQFDYEANDYTLDEGSDGLVLNDNGDIIAADTEDTQASAKAGAQSDIGDPASVTDAVSGDGAQSNNDTAKKNDTQDPASTKKDEAPKTTPKKATPEKQQSFQMPVVGDVSLEYAMDKLVYSKTLAEWRVHNGVDIASDRGTPVKAVADGVISDIVNDPHYGISVIIDHGNSIKTLYRNLATDENVTVNQKVKQGEVIGSIGNTAMDESVEPPHLHFEVLKDGINENPMDYLPK
jgi:murein DD-endopeptidase MepM/ murein hydrolase activator NlpD